MRKIRALRIRTSSTKPKDKPLKHLWKKEFGKLGYKLKLKYL